MPPKKVYVTESLTAELVSPRDRGHSKTHSSSAVADAIAVTNTQVNGVAAAMAMGTGMLAIFTSAAHAAHGATTAQSSATTVLEASTATGVATLYAIDTAAVSARRTRG
jgi:hypothetical protein